MIMLSGSETNCNTSTRTLHSKDTFTFRPRLRAGRCPVTSTVSLKSGCTAFNSTALASGDIRETTSTETVPGLLPLTDNGWDVACATSYGPNLATKLPAPACAPRKFGFSISTTASIGKLALPLDCVLVNAAISPLTVSCETVIFFTSHWGSRGQRKKASAATATSTTREQAPTRLRQQRRRRESPLKVWRVWKVSELAGVEVPSVRKVDTDWASKSTPSRSRGAASARKDAARAALHLSASSNGTAVPAAVPAAVPSDIAKTQDGSRAVCKTQALEPNSRQRA
mmetsp:Transcript_58024/g.168346  ORF Transcript_58024/g.168346 Transcript_58024/m.168346 type:complete len:284 (-) Transcript_58024:8-859(-)